MTPSDSDTEAPGSGAPTGRLAGILNGIEHLGNRLPHPALLFAYMAAGVLVLSAIGALAGVSAVHPTTGETIVAVNLLSGEGLRRILSGAVSNFTGFAPLGTVLVAMLGIGVAERAGLIDALLRRLVAAAPDRLLTFAVVFAGVLSSLGADSGYVVLIPLAALVFQAAGRHPIAGIAAAFAGVSAGFSANLLIGPLDAILAGLSQEAVTLVDPDYEVSVAGNWWFIIASTFLISAVGTFVTDRITEPRLGPGEGGTGVAETERPTPEQESRGLRAAGLVTLILGAGILAALVPESGALRDPETGSVLRSPFISGIVVIIALWAAAAGYAYGRRAGVFRSAEGAIEGMERTMGTMAGYLVLMFFAAQFVAWFGWTNLGVILAIQGAEALQALDPGTLPLLIVFILLAAGINLFIGSASAKWAIMAPVFVPMLYLLGLTPEATQMAYRVGDSISNIITPLMPYLALVVAFVQQYDRRAGIGTVVATMLPYSIALLIAWTALLTVWVVFDIPLGPGTPISLPGAG
jgi:aminobenzoyl-glutamate transport protein